MRYLPYKVFIGQLSLILVMVVSAGFMFDYSYADNGESACELLDGAAYGLCNAYCEAMDCDSEFPAANERACNRVADNYARATDGELPPCEIRIEPVCSELDIAECSGELISCVDSETGECVELCSFRFVELPDGSSVCEPPGDRCFPCGN